VFLTATPGHDPDITPQRREGAQSPGPVPFSALPPSRLCGANSGHAGTGEAGGDRALWFVFLTPTPGHDPDITPQRREGAQSPVPVPFSAVPKKVSAEKVTWDDQAGAEAQTDRRHEPKSSPRQRTDFGRDRA